MTKNRVGIFGIGKYIPKRILSNSDLEKMVDTSDDWIVKRTGIKERHLAEKNELASDMGKEAILDMIEKYNINIDDVELIVTPTVTGDMAFPSTSNFIAYKLGLNKNIACFDINAACAGFITALNVARNLVESGQYKNAIVVGVDKMQNIIDYTDRATCIIFGDAASCVYIKNTNDGTGIYDAHLDSNSEGVQFLYQKENGFVHQEGKAVFKQAVSKMIESINILSSNNNEIKNVSQIDWLVPHQANLRIIETVGQHLGIDKDKVTINIEKYGNTTDATIPLCLYDYKEKFKKNDNIILTAFGGGFVWGSIFLKWSI